MNHRFAPLALCAFFAASTSVADSTISARTISPKAVTAVQAPQAVGTRAGLDAAGHCAGPGKTGPYSFNGVSQVGNIAGGQFVESDPVPSAYAGVVAGCNNVAGDFYTGILAGQGNKIQPHGSDPDGSSYWSVIVGGVQNSIQISPDSIIAAGGGNSINNSVGSVIAAGGGNRIAPPPGYDYPTYSGIVAGSGNVVGGGTSFIGAGTNNIISSGFQYVSSSVIAGGDKNQIAGTDSLIVGGALNSIGNSAQNQTDQFAAIGGGSNNSIFANYATIAGGSHNSVTSRNGAVLGGTANVASGFAAAVGGGSTNTASGLQAAVPGGERNIAAGTNSFAGGTRSVASTAGSFVWSDAASGAKTVTTTAPNVFLVRASGGIAFYSAPNLASGVSLAPGSGAWSTLSDRNAKTGIEHVDEIRILAKLASMPVSEWSYRAQGTGVRHLGPMAQDFRAAFGLGEDDRHISTVDEEGIALAAIKALQMEVAEKDTQIAQLRRAQSDTDRADSRLEAKYANLAERLEALEGKAAR